MRLEAQSFFYHYLVGLVSLAKKFNLNLEPNSFNWGGCEIVKEAIEVKIKIIKSF